MEGIKTMHTLWRRTLTCMRNLHEMEAITLLQITKATKNKGTSLEVASSGIARTRENMSMSFYSLKRKDISMRTRKRRIPQRIAPCRLLHSVTHLVAAALRAVFLKHFGPVGRALLADPSAADIISNTLETHQEV